MKIWTLCFFLLVFCSLAEITLADCVPTKTLISDTSSCNAATNELRKVAVWDVTFGNNGTYRVVPSGIGYCSANITCWPSFYPAGHICDPW
jgi:hypothetical protein